MPIFYLGTLRKFMEIKKNIENLIAPIIKSMAYELWGIEMCPSGKRMIVRIYIDVPLHSKRRSVSLDDCVLVSRQIGALLDVEDIMTGSYDLEVSSPGLNRLLFKMEHYEQYRGSLICIYLRQPEGSQRKFTGNIHAVFADKLELMIDNEILAFELTNIHKAQLSL